MGAFAVFAARPALAGEVRYDLRLLSPAPGFTNVPPVAINNSGMIVGGSTVFDRDSPAVRWEPGASVATRLNGLGGVNSMGKIQDVASGINDSGVVVGWGIGADGQTVRALRWEPGATEPTDIGGSGTGSEAVEINNAGTVVGRGYVGGGGLGRRPAYWTPGATAFTVLPGGLNEGVDAHVHSVNGAGTFAGEVQGYAGPLAVTWKQPYTEFQFLPSLPGQPSTQASDINAAGSVVGLVRRDSGLTYHGFRYDPATETISELLGRPGVDPEFGSPATAPLRIIPSAVNADGVAVGRAGFINYERAVMWLPGSTDAVDLNSLIDPAAGLVLLSASDINDVGQIIGVARSSSGTSGAFYVLTPVPEPSLLGSALATLATAQRRRRRGGCRR